MNYLSKSYFQTEKIGEDFAKEIIKEKKEGIFIALKGDLGAGKTTFLKGFAKGLKIEETITSPTFIIFKSFKIPNREGLLFHFDCYRIEKEKEILNLGFEEIIKDKKNIVVVEWPEKIKKVIPKKHILIDFKLVSEDKRKIIVKIQNPKSQILNKFKIQNLKFKKEIKKIKK